MLATEVRGATIQALLKCLLLFRQLQFGAKPLPGERLTTKSSPAIQRPAEHMHWLGPLQGGAHWGKNSRQTYQSSLMLPHLGSCCSPLQLLQIAQSQNVTAAHHCRWRTAMPAGRQKSSTSSSTLQTFTDCRCRYQNVGRGVMGNFMSHRGAARSMFLGLNLCRQQCASKQRPVEPAGAAVQPGTCLTLMSECGVGMAPDLR